MSGDGGVLVGSKERSDAGGRGGGVLAFIGHGRWTSRILYVQAAAHNVLHNECLEHHPILVDISSPGGSGLVVRIELMSDASEPATPPTVSR